MKRFLVVVPLISFMIFANSAAAQCLEDSNPNSLCNGASNEISVFQSEDFGHDTIMNFTTADPNQPPATAPTCENGGLPAVQCPVQE